MRSHPFGWAPRSILLLLLGLESCRGELLRARNLEVEPRNSYWDLPPKTDRGRNSQRADNPYWQLPSHANNGELATDADTQEAASPPSVFDEVDKIMPALSPETSAERGNKLNESMDIMSQNLFLEQCLILMESHAEDGRLNKQQYIKFLQEISNDTLNTSDFTDLPLFLAMIFFSASCSSGEDCVSQEPAITIHHPQAAENGMNVVLCRQLMRFPFMEVLLPFQFLVRLDSGLSASELMMVSESEESDQVAGILPNLEGALDQVLLRGFNCSYVPGEPIQYTPKRKPKPLGPRRKSQFRQPQPQTDCNYVVDVTVEDAADYPCGFQSSCILIFSDVIVYAVPQESLDEPKLRKLTTDVLRDAINGNALNEFL